MIRIILLFSTSTLSSFQASCTPRYDTKLPLISNFNCILIPVKLSITAYQKPYYAVSLALVDTKTLVNTHATKIFA